MRLILCSLALVFSLVAAEVKLGKPLALKKAVTVDELLAKPDKKVGKTVQVKGKVTEVCQEMGCWMLLAGDTGNIRIKVEDGVIVFPKDAPGKIALAEGKLTKAENAGKTTYTIQGSGAVLLEN